MESEWRRVFSELRALQNELRTYQTEAIAVQDERFARLLVATARFVSSSVRFRQAQPPSRPSCEVLYRASGRLGELVQNRTWYGPLD